MAGDVPLVEEYRNVGLPIPSVIRPTKIATIETRHAKQLGRLPSSLWTEVAAALKRQLGLETAGENI